MTNKPMLSVELRALLERLLSHDFAEECQECGIGYSDARGELRALLDKEVDMDSDASKHQGDPVAWRYKKSWEKTGWKVCDKHPTDYGIDDECYEIQALYAEQPAPVADQAQCEECKGWGYHENHHEGGGTECGECGGSGNATVAVAVVMPDRMKVEPFTTIDLGSKNYKAGYNAAIAEVAKLNGLNP